MITPWIGYLELRARTPAAQFWSLKTDSVAGRLVLAASDAHSFEANLHQALAARDLELVKLRTAQPVTDQDSPELIAVAKDADTQTPLLFGRLCNAHLPHPAQITETKRESLKLQDDLWALLDGVSWPGLPDALAGSGDAYACLYTSTDPGTLASAPWLVRLRPGSGMAAKILARPADAHSGIFFESKATLPELRQHLRRFTMVQLPDGSPAPVYFRFYDPRVAMDMASALTLQTLGRFMDPIHVLYVPLSPTTVLPDHAVTALPITPFDSVQSCQPRIARITLPKRPVTKDRGGFRISSGEYAQFQKIQKKKAQRALARRMSVEFPGRDWNDYRTASEKAQRTGIAHGLTSVKQVSVLARCMMMQGPDFLSDSPEAANILKRRDLVPWQKKNALIKWLISAPIKPETAHV